MCVVCVPVSMSVYVYDNLKSGRFQVKQGKVDGIATLVTVARCRYSKITQGLISYAIAVGASPKAYKDRDLGVSRCGYEWRFGNRIG